MRRLTSNNDGFALFEVLVGLAVCGLLLTMIAISQSWNLKQAIAASSRLEVAVIERSLFETLNERHEMFAANLSGQTGRISWHEDIIPVHTLSANSSVGWMLFRVIIQTEGPGGIHSTLETYRLGKSSK